MKIFERSISLLLGCCLALSSCYSAPRWETARTFTSIPEDKATAIRPIVKSDRISATGSVVRVELKKEIEGSVWVMEVKEKVTETLWHPRWILIGAVGVVSSPLCLFGKEGTCSDWITGSIKALIGIPPESDRLTHDPSNTYETGKEVGPSKTIQIPWANGSFTVQINQQVPERFNADEKGIALIDLSKLLARLNDLPDDVTLLMTAKIGEAIRTETMEIPPEITRSIYASQRLPPATTGIQTEVSRQQVSDVDVPLTRRQRKHSYAIVIGVEQYRQKLPKADFADHDAKIMREYLTKLMGYSDENVVLLLNEHAAKSDFEKYLESWLPNHVEKEDSVFVYFSGHGAPNPRTGDAYLVPFDGDPAFVDKTGYPVKRLYEHLGKLPAKSIVVVLDSCFSGAGGRSVIAEGTRPMGLSVENPLVASDKILVLSASSGDQISNTYKAKGHGLLTYFLMKGLQGEGDQNRDGAVDMVELYEYLRPHVERMARREFNNEQTPQLLGGPGILNKGVRLVEKPN